MEIQDKSYFSENRRRSKKSMLVWIVFSIISGFIDLPLAGIAFFRYIFFLHSHQDLPEAIPDHVEEEPREAKEMQSNSSILNAQLFDDDADNKKISNVSISSISAADITPHKSSEESVVIVEKKITEVHKVNDKHRTGRESLRRLHGTRKSNSSLRNQSERAGTTTACYDLSISHQIDKSSEIRMNVNHFADYRL
jgi:hypothetical protein